MKIDEYETPRGLKRWICECRASNTNESDHCYTCYKMKDSHKTLQTVSGFKRRRVIIKKENETNSK